MWVDEARIQHEPCEARYPPRQDGHGVVKESMRANLENLLTDQSYRWC